MLESLFAEPIQTLGYASPVIPTLAGELHRIGHHVSIVTTSTEASVRLEYHADRLSLFIVPARGRARERALDLFAAERKTIAAAIVESRPDVVHANWTYEFALAALEANAAPTLVTARDAPLTVLRLMPDAYRLFRFALAVRVRWRTCHLTTVSPDLAKRWRNEMFWRRPIAVIPNPLPSFVVHHGTRSGPPIVIGIGNNSRLKNYRALLRAFPRVRAVDDRAELRLIGPGLDAGGSLARWARDRGLDRSVAFVGPIDRSELARELSTATVFCHPSLAESFGNVLLEALMAGLPVIAGERSGGVPWVLFDGRAGLLVDVRSPVAIADGIIAAIDEPLSTVAPDFNLEAELRNRYSIELVTQQYVAEYSRIMAMEQANGCSRRA